MSAHKLHIFTSETYVNIRKINAHEGHVYTWDVYTQ